MQRTSKLLVALALFAAAPAFSSSDADSATQKELSAYMDARVRENDFSGSVLVSRSGKRLLVRGYGLANRDWSIPNTPSTKFRIGSLTKGFTAALIMQLHERGLVDLSGSICSYISPVQRPGNRLRCINSFPTPEEFTVSRMTPSSPTT